MDSIKIKKLCIVTGGTSGLGLSLVKQLLYRKETVLIVSKNKDKLLKTVCSLANQFPFENIEYIDGDISKKITINKIEQLISEKSYVVSHLFNNAGTGKEESLLDITEDTLDDILNTNLKGLILLTSSILKITPSDRELNIINIMSTSALVGRAREATYCASKWAVRGFTESMRLELKDTKRNVYAIYPGGMQTPMWNIINPNKDISTYMDPSEVAEIIIFNIFDNLTCKVLDLTINRK